MLVAYKILQSLKNLEKKSGMTPPERVKLQWRIFRAQGVT